MENRNDHVQAATHHSCEPHCTFGLIDCLINISTEYIVPFSKIALFIRFGSVSKANIIDLTSKTGTVTLALS